MKKIIVVPDVHMAIDVPKAYQIVKRFIKSQKPDEVVLLGDFMDCSSLSHWDESKARPMEGQRWLKEVDVANKELDFLQKYSKKVTYLEGNHENWVEQYVDKHPEMEGLIEIPLKLDLDKRGIEWHKYNRLYQIGSLYFTHGCYATKYHANKHISNFGCNLVYGHTHRWDSTQMVMKMQDPYIAYGLGCLSDKEPTYMHGRPCAWINQFAVVYIDDDNNYNLYPINIIDDKFIFEGKLYK